MRRRLQCADLRNSASFLSNVDRFPLKRGRVLDYRSTRFNRTYARLLLEFLLIAALTGIMAGPPPFADAPQAALQLGDSYGVMLISTIIVSA